MASSIEFTPVADADFEKLEPIEASLLLDKLDELLPNPYAVSSQPGFPHPLLWKFQFWGAGDYGRTHYTVLWELTRDEEIVVIYHIGVVRYGEPPG
jgi:hypothetical protein